MSGKAPIPTRDPQVYEGANVIVPVGGWQVVRSKRDPTTNDKKYPVATLWINTVLQNIWIQTAPAGHWTQLISAGTSLVQVANGGTGDVTLTAHGVLIGEGTSPVAVTAAGTTGQVLIGSTGADPAFGNLGVNSGLTAHGVLVGEGNSAIAAVTPGTSGEVLFGITGGDPVFGDLLTQTGLSFTFALGSMTIDVETGGYNVNAASAGGSLVEQNLYTVTQAGQASFALPAAAAVGDRFLVASALGNTAGWIITQGAGQEIWADTNHTTNGVGGTLAGAIHTSVELMCTIANLEFIVVGGSGLTGLTFV